MTRRHWTTAAAVFSMALLAGLQPAWAANGLTVTNAAAQAGNYGLQINLDGTTNAAYVKDDSPVDESHYRARFWIHPGTSDITDNKGVRVFALDTTSFGQDVLLFLRHDTPVGLDQYQLTLWVKEPANSVPVYKASMFLCLEGARAWRQVEVEFTRDTDPTVGVGNGNVTMRRLAPTTPTERPVNNLDSDTYDVTSVRLGVLADTGKNHNVCAAEACSIWADEFESYR